MDTLPFQGSFSLNYLEQGDEAGAKPDSQSPCPYGNRFLLIGQEPLEVGIDVALTSHARMGDRALVSRANDLGIFPECA